MYSERIHKAIMFASKAHKNQTRKGTDIPYIYHPMEVLQILTEMGCDEDGVSQEYHIYLSDFT